MKTFVSRNSKLSRDLLLDFLQEGQSRGDVLGNFVTFGKRIQSAFLRFSGEEVKGHSLPSLEDLLAAMEDIGFSRFFALYGVSHRVDLG